MVSFLFFFFISFDFKNIHRFGRDLSRRTFFLPQLAYQNIHISFYLKSFVLIELNILSESTSIGCILALTVQSGRKTPGEGVPINCGSVLQGKGGARKGVRNGPCELELSGRKGWWETEPTVRSCHTDLSDGRTSDLLKSHVGLFEVKWNLNEPWKGKAARSFEVS